MGSSWTARAGRCAITLWALCALLAGSADAQGICSLGPDNPIVRFETNLGDFDVLLCRANVPETVDNFIQYVNDGAYTNSGVVHRSVRSTPGVVPKNNIDIIQGGGFWGVDPGTGTGAVLHPVVTRPPIPLQAALQNRAGTIAMARTNQPNTANSQWYINVLDNPSLDPTGPNTGYAVFGEVISGMASVEEIHAQQIWNLGTAVFASFPLIDYPGTGLITLDHFVTITNVSVVPEPALAAGTVAVLATLGLLAARRRRASGRLR